MKILHINTSQVGGAALCAIRINKALVQQGIECRMLFAEGNSLPEGVEGGIAINDPISWNKHWITEKWRHLINRMPWVHDVWGMRFKLKKAIKHLDPIPYVHQPCSTFTNIAHHPLVEWADIIHLHWVSDFVDYPSFFKAINKPIVWTLHDQFPVNGLLHFRSVFYPLPQELLKLDSMCVRIKKDGISQSRNLYIVAISREMKKICLQSDILKDRPCTLIHNGVDTSIFKPTHNEIPPYSIPTSATVFLFSSYWIGDKNKGLQRTIDALEQVRCDDKFLVVVGINDCQPSASFPILCTGFVHNQCMLASLYTRADYFIQASYDEAFGQTSIEAMACGCPVISTPCSGPQDLILSFNGVICTDFDPLSIAFGIEQALNSKYNRDVIRQYIIDNFDYAKIAKEYLSLYYLTLNNVKSNTTITSA